MYLFKNSNFMSLEQQISKGIMEAMKAKDTVRLGALRNAKKYIIEAKTAGPEITELPDADVLKIISKLAKQGTDSAAIFTEQNRPDLAAEELAQVAVFQEFLPKQLTAEELAAEMGMPVEKVREILKIAQEPVSLETPIGEEEDSHLGDFIPDEGASEPSEAASYTLLKEQLVSVLSTLTPREEKVLKLRFGIEDGRTRTLEEVGKEFNVTRERIRQIEAKALRKLRHPSRSKKLKDFLH